MGDYKDEHGISRVTSMLEKIGKGGLIDKAKAVITAAGSGNILEVVGALFKNESNITVEQHEAFDKAYELDLKDRADARAMQVSIATSKNSTTLSKNFVYYIASFWSIVTASYIFLITFTKVVNERVSDTVLGFLLGTIIATIINYFFGSSQGSKDKFNQLIKKK